MADLLFGAVALGLLVLPVATGRVGWGPWAATAAGGAVVGAAAVGHPRVATGAVVALLLAPTAGLLAVDRWWGAAYLLAFLVGALVVRPR